MHVAAADRGVEAVEHAHVLVVEVDVDVAVQLAAAGEQLRLGVGVLVGQRAQDVADVVAAGVDLLDAAGRGRSTGGMRTMAIGAEF